MCFHMEHSRFPQAEAIRQSRKAFLTSSLCRVTWLIDAKTWLREHVDPGVCQEKMASSPSCVFCSLYVCIPGRCRWFGAERLVGFYFSWNVSYVGGKIQLAVLCLVDLKLLFYWFWCRHGQKKQNCFVSTSQAINKSKCLNKVELRKDKSNLLMKLCPNIHVTAVSNIFTLIMFCVHQSAAALKPKTALGNNNVWNSGIFCWKSQDLGIHVNANWHTTGHQKKPNDIGPKQEVCCTTPQKLLRVRLIERRRTGRAVGILGFSLSKTMTLQVLWVKEDPHDKKRPGFSIRTLYCGHVLCYKLYSSVVFMIWLIRVPLDHVFSEEFFGATN